MWALAREPFEYYVILLLTSEPRAQCQLPMVFKECWNILISNEAKEQLKLAETWLGS